MILPSIMALSSMLILLLFAVVAPLFPRVPPPMILPPTLALPLIVRLFSFASLPSLTCAAATPRLLVTVALPLIVRLFLFAVLP